MTATPSSAAVGSSRSHWAPAPFHRRPESFSLRRVSLLKGWVRPSACGPLPPQSSGPTIRGRHPLPSGSSSVVERQLPKLHVAGSIPVSRSSFAAASSSPMWRSSPQVLPSGWAKCVRGPSGRGSSRTREKHGLSTNSSKTACDFVAGAATARVAARQNAVSQKTADVAEGRILGALGDPCPF